MTKNEFIAAVAEKTELTKKDTEITLNAILDTIQEALANGEKIQFTGFGSFETKERAARTGRNPRNPEETIEIPAAKQPTFKAGKVLKDAVNR